MAVYIVRPSTLGGASARHFRVKIERNGEAYVADAVPARKLGPPLVWQADGADLVAIGGGVEISTSGARTFVAADDWSVRVEAYTGRSDLIEVLSSRQAMRGLPGAHTVGRGDGGAVDALKRTFARLSKLASGSDHDAHAQEIDALRVAAISEAFVHPADVARMITTSPSLASAAKEHSVALLFTGISMTDGGTRALADAGAGVWRAFADECVRAAPGAASVISVMASDARIATIAGADEGMLDAAAAATAPVPAHEWLDAFAHMKRLMGEHPDAAASTLADIQGALADMGGERVELDVGRVIDRAEDVLRKSKKRMVHTYDTMLDTVHDMLYKPRDAYDELADIGERAAPALSKEAADRVCAYARGNAALVASDAEYTEGGRWTVAMGANVVCAEHGGFNRPLLDVVLLLGDARRDMTGGKGYSDPVFFQYCTDVHRACNPGYWTALAAHSETDTPANRARYTLNTSASAAAAYVRMDAAISPYGNAQCAGTLQCDTDALAGLAMREDSALRRAAVRPVEERGAGDDGIAALFGTAVLDMLPRDMHTLYGTLCDIVEDGEDDRAGTTERLASIFSELVGASTGSPGAAVRYAKALRALPALYSGGAPADGVVDEVLGMIEQSAGRKYAPSVRVTAPRASTAERRELRTRTKTGSAWGAVLLKMIAVLMVMLFVAAAVPAVVKHEREFAVRQYVRAEPATQQYAPLFEETAHVAMSSAERWDSMMGHHARTRGADAPLIALDTGTRGAGAAAAAAGDADSGPMDQYVGTANMYLGAARPPAAEIAGRVAEAEAPPAEAGAGVWATLRDSMCSLLGIGKRSHEDDMGRMRAVADAIVGAQDDSAIQQTYTYARSVHKIAARLVGEGAYSAQSVADDLVEAIKAARIDADAKVRDGKADGSIVISLGNTVSAAGKSAAVKTRRIRGSYMTKEEAMHDVVTFIVMREMGGLDTDDDPKSMLRRLLAKYTHAPEAPPPPPPDDDPPGTALESGGGDMPRLDAYYAGMKKALSAGGNERVFEYVVGLLWKVTDIKETLTRDIDRVFASGGMFSGAGLAEHAYSLNIAEGLDDASIQALKTVVGASRMGAHQAMPINFALGTDASAQTLQYDRDAALETALRLTSHETYEACVGTLTAYTERESMRGAVGGVLAAANATRKGWHAIAVLTASSTNGVFSTAPFGPALRNNAGLVALAYETSARTLLGYAAPEVLKLVPVLVGTALGDTFCGYDTHAVSVDVVSIVMMATVAVYVAKIAKQLPVSHMVSAAGYARDIARLAHYVTYAAGATAIGGGLLNAAAMQAVIMPAAPVSIAGVSALAVVAGAGVAEYAAGAPSNMLRTFRATTRTGTVSVRRAVRDGSTAEWMQLASLSLSVILAYQGVVGEAAALGTGATHKLMAIVAAAAAHVLADADA